MSNPSQDASIPLLTEIIERPVHEEITDDIPELPMSSALPPESLAPPLSPQELPTIATSPLSSGSATVSFDNNTQEKWVELEQRISERTLHALQARLTPLLEEQIRESISASLDEAMDTIRANLQLSIEQLVRESVRQEIRDLEFSKNNKN